MREDQRIFLNGRGPWGAQQLADLNMVGNVFARERLADEVIKGITARDLMEPKASPKRAPVDPWTEPTPTEEAPTPE